MKTQISVPWPGNPGEITAEDQACKKGAIHAALKILIKSIMIGFLPVVLLISCRPVQHDLRHYTGSQLIFGSGGGFSGATTAYILLEKGEFFRQNSMPKDTVRLPPINRKKARHLFQQLEALHIQQSDFNHPGNLYYFIEHKEGDEQHRIVWGDSEHPPPAGVKNFYQTLLSIIPKDSP